MQWELSDKDIPAGSVGIVHSAVTNKGGYAVVRFGRGLFELRAKELRCVQTSPRLRDEAPWTSCVSSTGIKKSLSCVNSTGIKKSIAPCSSPVDNKQTREREAAAAVVRALWEKEEAPFEPAPLEVVMEEAEVVMKEASAAAREAPKNERLDDIDERGNASVKPVVHGCQPDLSPTGPAEEYTASRVSHPVSLCWSNEESEEGRKLELQDQAKTSALFSTMRQHWEKRDIYWDYWCTGFLLVLRCLALDEIWTPKVAPVEEPAAVPVTECTTAHITPRPGASDDITALAPQRFCPVEQLSTGEQQTGNELSALQNDDDTTQSPLQKPTPIRPLPGERVSPPITPASTPERVSPLVLRRQNQAIYDTAKIAMLRRYGEDTAKSPMPKSDSESDALLGQTQRSRPAEPSHDLTEYKLACQQLQAEINATVNMELSLGQTQQQPPHDLTELPAAKLSRHRAPRLPHRTLFPLGSPHRKKSLVRTKSPMLPRQTQQRPSHGLIEWTDKQTTSRASVDAGEAAARSSGHLAPPGMPPPGSDSDSEEDAPEMPPLSREIDAGRVMWVFRSTQDPIPEDRSMYL